MKYTLTKTCRRADLSFVQDAFGAVSLVIMLVGSLHLPALF
ncbi:MULTISPECIES: hypothetical protein [unclassified Marinovum]